MSRDNCHIETIELITEALKDKKGMTGKEDCDNCKQSLIADAIDIFKLIHTKFEILPKDIQTEQ